MFGNAPFLAKSSSLWWEVLRVMAEAPRRIGFYLPLQCTNHGNVTFVKDADDLAGLQGGCRLLCPRLLPCSHQCELQCHPLSYECKASCECQSATETETKTLGARPSTEQTSTRGSAADLRDAELLQLDEENTQALFGTGSAGGADEMRLVGLKDDGHGGQRQRWRGVYRPRRQQEEASLLDL